MACNGAEANHRSIYNMWLVVSRKLSICVQWKNDTKHLLSINTPLQFAGSAKQNMFTLFTLFTLF